MTAASLVHYLTGATPQLTLLLGLINILSKQRISIKKVLVCHFVDSELVTNITKLIIGCH
jgi:hypothetical protein